MKFSKVLGAIAAAALAVTSLAIPTSAADSYHAYIGVQEDTAWSFRNAWNDATYGQGITSDDGMVFFDQITGWDGNTPLDKGGEFTDVEITGDGTYKVGLSGDFDFGAAESFSLLFVSTDIPLDCGATITDVKVIIDGNTVYTFDEAFLSPDEKTYMQPMAINIWNSDLGGKDGLFGYMMPSTSVEIEFTVTGLPAAAETPAADATTDSATTGNAPVALAVAALAVSGTVAIASRKRK